MSLNRVLSKGVGYGGKVMAFVHDAGKGDGVACLLVGHSTGNVKLLLCVSIHAQQQ
jgi:hypothetical protein